MLPCFSNLIKFGFVKFLIIAFILIVKFCFSNGGKEPNPFDEESEEWDDGGNLKFFLKVIYFLETHF